MKEIKFLPFPLIETGKFRLRQLTMDDQEEIFLLRSDEELLKYTEIIKAKTIEDARQYILKINEGIEKNEAILWGIGYKDDPKLIGTICLWNIVKEESKADIGFMLLPEYQGKGVMQEVIPAVIDYGFNTMGLSTIHGEASPENIKSIALMKRFGFTFEKEDLNTVFYSLKNDEREKRMIEK